VRELLLEAVSSFKCVAETVARFDGFIAKYMGDGCSFISWIRQRMTGPHQR